MKGNSSKILYNRAVNGISIHHTAVIFFFMCGTITGPQRKWMESTCGKDEAVIERYWRRKVYCEYSLLINECRIFYGCVKDRNFRE